MLADKMLFVSPPIVCDWNAEWQQLQAKRRRMPDAAFWDERAKTFSEKDSPNQYVADFLRLANIRVGESVFDMGCGAGDLTIPLAEAGHAVTAADFSAGMLGVLGAKLERRSLGGVEKLQMSWDDDWAAFGLEPDSFDVCLASRSLTVGDLEKALLKLDSLACRRVCVTLSTGSSPRNDDRVLRELGLKSVAGADHLYAFAILAQHGIRAEVSYIDSERVDFFDGFEEAYSYYARMVVESAACESPERFDQALSDLREWLPGQLTESDPTENLRGIEGWKPLRTVKPRIVSWAFVAWDK